jgi:hypothetical protein
MSPLTPQKRPPKSHLIRTKDTLATFITQKILKTFRSAGSINMDKNHLFYYPIPTYHMRIPTASHPSMLFVGFCLFAFFLVVQEFELRALSLLGRCSTSWVMLQYWQRWVYSPKWTQLMKVSSGEIDGLGTLQFIRFLIKLAFLISAPFGSIWGCCSYSIASH